MEKYTRNARFCLICNYVSKIIPALQSRCTKFRFAPLDASFVRERLNFVIESERCARARTGHCRKVAGSQLLLLMRMPVHAPTLLRVR